MTFVILTIDGVTAREVERWDWNALIEPDVGEVSVNAFDTEAELVAAIWPRRTA